MRVAERIKKRKDEIKAGDLIIYAGVVCMLVEGTNELSTDYDHVLIALEGEDKGEIIDSFLTWYDLQEVAEYEGLVLPRELVYITSVEEDKEC